MTLRILRRPTLTMPTIPWLIFAGFLFLLSSFPSLVGAAHNVTVDDSDTTLITYVPLESWRTESDPLDIGGTNKVTANRDATATFTFTGTAIYFYAPLYPFDMTTQISLDGAGPVVLNLMDPDTVTPIPDGAATFESSVAWFAGGLDNNPHTFVVTVASGSPRAIVDGFVYTVPDAGDPTTTDSSSTATTTSSTLSSSTSFLPRPTTSTTSSSTSSSSSPTDKKGLSIALGIVCTVFALLVLYGAYWYWRRRQRLLREEQEEEEYRRNNPSTGENTTTAENNGNSPNMDYAYKRQPSTWQRNARGRLIAAPTGITTMIPTVEQGGNMNLSPSVGAGAGASSSSSRGPRKGPRRHGPSPLSMSSTSTGSAAASSSSSSSSSGNSNAPGSPGRKGKNPLTTIPEMRMREDDALLSASPFDDGPSSTRVGAGSTKWTTFDQNGS